MVKVKRWSVSTDGKPCILKIDTVTKAILSKQCSYCKKYFEMFIDLNAHHLECKDHLECIEEKKEEGASSQEGPSCSKYVILCIHLLFSISVILIDDDDVVSTFVNIINKGKILFSCFIPFVIVAIL